MPSTLSHDYETYSDVDLKRAGGWRYACDTSTEALMVSYRIDQQQLRCVDLTCDPIPREFEEALLDPHVEKWAFNAAFERLTARKVLGIKTPYKGWRCTMFRAYGQSFAGGLLQVGEALGIEGSELKDKAGERLIKTFCVPQRVTQANQLARRDSQTNPDEWQQFLNYNARDVVAEEKIKSKLLRYPFPDDEWELYELDQEINDRGLPVNRRFVEQADAMSTRRKAELIEAMRRLTGLKNPNSAAQLLPWLQERGYPFSDLQKNTVTKVIAERKAQEDAGEKPGLDIEGLRGLKLRQKSNKASVKKYPAILERLAPDDRLRHCFQIGGASRTLRWAGRGPQPHNLTRTPKFMEPENGDAYVLESVAETIESGDYDLLGLMCEEPLTALSGSVRSSFQAPDDMEFVVCDLSAIESAVTAWLCRCVRLLAVFTDKRDPYKDFATELYKVAYDLVDKIMRTICKPAVLGCSYQLGGGELKEGKRTGLWGYAENMGVNITREEAHRQVQLFRTVYHEIPAMWRKLEQAAQRALMGYPVTVNGLLKFEMRGPYMTIELPSGRHMYYHKPRMVERVFEGKDGPYTRTVFSYMGMVGVTGRKWGRVFSSGGKLFENVVQATARDVLKAGMLRAKREKFPIVGTVHDEIIGLVRRGDNRRTLPLLRDCMMAPISWAAGLPLGAAGYQASIYRKD